MQRQLYGSQKEILVESNFDLDRALVFLPGISGKAHSDRFKPLVQIAEDLGCACVRVNLWEDAEAINETTYANLHERLNETLTTLDSLGFIDIALIGKSFGGAVALTYEHQMVSQKILWAPAIGVATAGNFSERKTSTLADVLNVLDVTVGKEWLPAQTLPIGIVHGSNDEVVPLTNSEAILAEVPNGRLEIIDGADHSFKTPEHEAALYAATQDLLLKL